MLFSSWVSVSGPYQTPVPALISVRPASVSLSPVSPLAPRNRPARRVVIPEPAHCAAGPSGRAAHGQGRRPAEVCRPIRSACAVLALASNTTLPPFSMLVVPLKS